MKHILFFFLSLTLLLSCKKQEITQLPTVSTVSATNITSSMVWAIVKKHLPSLKVEAKNKIA